MGLRDLFDPDKRSKDALREEIRLRDMQVASLQATLARLQDERSNTSGSTVPSAQPGLTDTHVAVNLADELAQLQALSEEQRQTIQALRQELLDLKSTAASDQGPNSPQDTQIEDQRRAIEGLHRKVAELKATAAQDELKRQVLLQALQDERAHRQDEETKRREEHQKLRNALAALKEKRQASSSQPGELLASPAAEVSTNAAVPAPRDGTPPRDRTYYSAAHRVLMLREERIESAEKSLDSLLMRFGITDKSQAVNLVARVAELERELQTLREANSGHDSASLQRQLIAASEQLIKQAQERDQALEQLKQERKGNAVSDVARLREQLDSAQIEIKLLKQGQSGEVWKLKGRVEAEERKYQDREFEFRNLGIRVADLEKTNAALKEETKRLTRETVSAAVHHAECARLQADIRSEKALAEAQRKEAERLQRELGTTKAVVTRLTQDVATARARSAASSIRHHSPFSSHAVLRWSLANSHPEAAKVPNGWLGRIGDEPWPGALFQELLEEIGFEFWETPDADLRHLIVGRNGWTKEGLLEQIDSVGDQPIRIYSQEMFLGKILTGRDPFDSNDQTLLMAFAQGHPALEFLLSLPVPWPTVSEHESGGIDPVDPNDYGVSETPLHKLGYHVGATSSLTVSQRRRILTECLNASSLQFTPDSTTDYRRKWGRGGSAQRLYRMAVHIKWLTESLGRDHRRPQARADWISDLEWLRKTYYAPVRKIFSWP